LKVMVESRYMKKKVQAIHRIPDHKIIVNPGGVDLKRFKPSLKRNKLKTQFNLPKARTHLLTVRNLEPRMGLDNLLKCMAHLKKQKVKVELCESSRKPKDLYRSVAIMGHDFGAHPSGKMTIERKINRIYKWSFNNLQWKIELSIPVETYERYVYANIDRSPQNQPFPEEAMAAFVTSNEKEIIDLADELKKLADSRRFNTYNTANFILRFVQINVEYTLDNESQGCIEYWKFPVETLVDKNGDCEDSAILYASIMDALGYDVVLLFYKLEDKNSGHLAVGIHLEGEHGVYVEDDGIKYFYCETTTSQFNIGQLPPEIKGKPKRIIHI